MSDDESTRIDVDSFEHETEGALLFLVDDEKLWVPKAVVTGYSDDFVDVDWWWANENGLD